MFGPNSAAGESAVPDGWSYGFWFLTISRGSALLKQTTLPQTSLRGPCPKAGSLWTLDGPYETPWTGGTSDVDDA